MSDVSLAGDDYTCEVAIAGSKMTFYKCWANAFRGNISVSLCDNNQSS
jgi:hypothetical protein